VHSASYFAGAAIPQEARHAACTPHHDAASVPQGTPQQPHGTAEAPQPGPATAPSLETLLEHIQRIAETAMQYDKLSLADLSQLLFDRQIYRAKDRKSGEDKPVNRGTLQKWLEQARRAGVL